MPRFLLVRHAHVATLGSVIVGRMGGVLLDAEGLAELPGLVRELEPFRPRLLYSSPLERAVETAGAIGRAFGLGTRVSDPLVELDYGEWTGRSLDELRRQDRFECWNRFRSGARIPGGELMVEVQARAVAELERLSGLHPDESIALVSHGDVIRALLCHYLGMPLDHLHRLTVGPASVTALDVDGGGARLLCLNLVGRARAG